MSDYDYAKYQRDRLEAARRYDAEQSKASLTGAQPAPAAPSATMTDDNAGQMIADMLMECAERLGNFPQADVDRRAWRHLLVYAPADSATITLQQRVAELVEQHGSLRAAAKVLECDVGYLSRLASGEKDEPGDLLRRRMGLRRVVTFTRAAASKERSKTHE